MEQRKPEIVHRVSPEISATPEQICLPVGASLLGTLLPKEKDEFEISLDKKLGGGSSKKGPTQKCTFEVTKRTNRSPLDANAYAVKITTEGKNADWKKGSKIQIRTTYDGKNIELTGSVIEILPMRVTGTNTKHEVWVTADLHKIEEI